MTPKRYFIDTNILLYIAENYDMLSKQVVRILKDYENLIYVSAAVMQEVSYLRRTKAILMDDKKWATMRDIYDYVEKELCITVKYINREHILALGELEIVETNTDPMDRIIVAHAITEGIPLISSDKEFFNYKDLDFVFNG